MALQFSDTVRNARLDAIMTSIGASGAVLEIRSGTVPANCAAADTGTLLASISLPNPWMASAATGSVSKTGTAWQDASADNTGTASYFRIKQGATTHCQGTVGIGTGDLQVDNTSFASGQSFTVTGFTVNDPNN